MQVTLRQPVHSLDGPFGELADIVVDPATNDVTHLIVEPLHRHYQARLVPMSLVELGDGELTIQLDDDHVRALEGVAESDYIPITQPIELAEGWDVGVAHIRALPSFTYGSDLFALPGQGVGGLDGYLSVDYDRVPHGECEIRHESRVIGADQHLLGLVNGVIVDDGHIEGVVVQTGVVGLRHNVAVPISAVARVRTDEIALTIDRQTFRRLTPIDEPVDGEASVLARVEHRIAGAAKRAGSALRSKLGRS